MGFKMKDIKNHIEESLIKSYDTNKLIDKIKNRYKDIEVSLYPSKSDESLFTITFNDKDNYERFLEDIYIQKQLDFFGYYITEKIDKKLLIAIEPNFGTKCTDFVYNNCNGLIFHITSKEFYKNNIKYKGLKPKIGNIKKYRYFTERIFLICGETTDEIIENIELIIDQKGYEKDSYVILMIDLKENHYNVNFYYDPSEDNWHNCIYCNAYFPYKYINEIKNITDIKANIDENLTVAKSPWRQT